MKKTILLFASVLMTLVGYSQHFASKSDAVKGIVRPAQTISQTQTVQRNTLNTTYFTDDFENGLGSWTTADLDGDTYTWDVFDMGSSYAHSGTKVATSASYIGGVGPLNPDNLLISPAIDLSSATGTTVLEWFVAAQDQSWPSEVYRVLISTTGGTDLNNYTEIYPDETVQAGGPEGNYYWKRIVDISSYNGQTVYVCFEHHNVTDMFRINIDDVSVYSVDVTDAGITDITAPSNETSCSLSSAEDVTVTIFNYGGTHLTDFDVSYTIDGGTPVTEHVSGVDIAPASSYNYTFNQQADLSNLGYYEISASVQAAGDVDSSNDSKTINVTSGDANLVIEVASDNNGGQAWTLVDSGNNVIASHGSYQWNITETTTVCLLDNDCYTFHWVSETGTSNTVTLTYNGTQINQTTATGNYDVFAIGGNCSATDAALTELNIPNYGLINAPMDIQGTVQNQGSDPITSFDVTYTVDGGTQVGPYNVTGINLATGDTYDFIHDVQFTPANSGIVNIEVSISNVNGGNNDTNLNNNVMSKQVNIASQATQRIPLYEEFTSSTCSPCATFNSDYFNQQFLNNNTGRYNLIKYQVWWPSPGDPYTTPEVSDRVSYYGINSAPTLLIDSYETTQFDTGILQQNLDFVYNMPAVMEVNAIHTVDVSNSMAYVRVTVNPYVTGNYTLRCAVVERTTTGNVGGNGETEFYNVMMKMVPDANGMPISLTTDTPQTFDISASLNGTFIEEMTDLDIIVFIQDDNDKSIMQSAKSVDSPNAVNEQVFNEVKLYPNPAKNTLFVQQAEGLNIQIFTIGGSLVYSQNNLNKNNTIRLDNLSQGVYIVKLIKDDQTAVRKLIITK
jgi:hypothetical protein